MTKKEEQYELRKYQILDISLTHFIRYGVCQSGSDVSLLSQQIIFVRGIGGNRV